MTKVKGFFRKEKLAFQKDDKSAYLFSLPYVLVFIIFIIVPIFLAILLATTSFDMVNFPDFIGFDNFVYLFTADSEFMRTICNPNRSRRLYLILFNGLVFGSTSA
jgi:multiple sugar transport system permease protein